VRKPLALLLLLLLIFLLILPPAAVAGEENGGNPAENALREEEIRPLLIIERVNAEKAVAGSFFYVTLVIKNHSDYPAFNIRADVSVLGESKKIFAREKAAADGTPDLEKIEGQQTRSFTFAVNTSPEAENKDYNMLLTLEYQSAMFGKIFSSSASIIVPVVYELTRPKITVSNVVLDPKTPAAQEAFTAVFYLDNFSSTQARNVTVELDGGNNFKALDFTSTKFLKSVTRGAGDFVLFKLQPLEGRSGNTVSLKFTFDYAGETQVSQEPLTVNLPLGYLEPGSSPFLKVKSFSLQEASRSGEHLLCLTLENRGQEAAQDISLSLDGGTNIYILHSSNIDFIEKIDGKTEVTRKYTMGINPSQGSLYFPLKVLLIYSDRRGNSYESAETLGISSTGVVSAATGTPRVLISKYTLSDEKILAGNVVTLSLYIENTHSRPVYNTKVSFKVIEMEGSTGGTVFSPVNSSNSFFIEQIPGRTTAEKSIDFLVDPNASAKTYIVPVTIEYEDESANSYTVNELVNIPVTQECKLQVLSLEVPPSAPVGQPVFISAEFVNVGKAALKNFIVMLEGDFHKEQASYYVGNLEIGASDFYQGIIYPEQEGPLTGKIIFSYIDNNNREVQIEEPFEIEIIPMMMPKEPFPGEFPGGRDPRMPEAPGSRGGLTLFYIILPVAVLAGVGILLWRRKIKKRNEEFLDA